MDVDKIKNIRKKHEDEEAKQRALAPKPKIDKNLSVIESIKVRCVDCFIKDRCPHFDAKTECKFKTFDKSIEGNAKEAINRLLVLQIDRINRMSLIEKFEGGYADSTLSREMDRFFNLLKALKDLGDTRDTLEIKAKGQGIVSKIFGKFSEGEQK